MKFIGYCRCSTKVQGEAYSIPAQREALQRYLASVPNAELLRVFDEVETGTNDNRPQLQAAIALCKQLKAKLLISRLDRLSRNAAFLMMLMDSNLDFICCDLPNIDRFCLSILACVSQHERNLISLRTSQGLAVARARGVILGNPKLADARKNALIAIQAQKRAFAASAHKAIREVQSAGVTSYNAIASCLTKRGERTSRGGRVWTATGVKRVLGAI